MASENVINTLKSLHRELDRLEPAIRHVEIAQEITKMVKDIPQKHIELLAVIKSNDNNHKSELQQLFKEELHGITDETKKIASTTSRIQEEINTELLTLGKVRESLQAFHERIEKINFPERLDKLDANIAGIMAAILSIQSRLDNVERNIIDRLQTMTDSQKTALKGLENILISTARKQQALSLITWGLLVIAALAIIIIQMKIK